MTDLRQFREIEKLVEDSVFLPSPRHHLRERVLKNAVEAKYRQKLWQRFVVGTSALMGMLLIAFLVMRPSAPGPKLATEVGPVHVQIYSPGQSVRPTPQASPAPAASLGEEMYFGPVRPQDARTQGAIAPNSGSEQSNSSTGKSPAPNPE